MTTLREIKKLFAPLLGRHDDMVLAKHTVVLKPMRHILLGVTIDRTRSASEFVPKWIATELFRKKNEIPIAPGEVLRHPSGLWFLTDPDITDVLADVVERDALPRLRALDDIGAFADFVLPKDPEERKFYAAYEVLCLLALGDLDAVHHVILAQEQAAEICLPRFRDFGFEHKFTATSFHLDAAERARLAAYLHDREAYTVEKLGLGAIWEKTPFPLELSGSGPGTIDGLSPT